MERDAGRELRVTVVKAHTACVDTAHHAHDILHLIRAAEAGAAHVAAGGVAHFQFLEMERRLREEIEIADMVVMQVRDDDVLHLRRVDAEQLQAARGTAQMLATALGGHGGGEAGVDDDLAALAADQPDEVVERHRPVVRITADEVFRRAPIVMRVLERVNLVR